MNLPTFDLQYGQFVRTGDVPFGKGGFTEAIFDARLDRQGAEGGRCVETREASLKDQGRREKSGDSERRLRLYAGDYGGGGLMRRMSASILNALIIVGVLVCIVGFVTGHRWLGLPGGLLAFLAAVEQMVRTDRADRPLGDQAVSGARGGREDEPFPAPFVA